MQFQIEKQKESLIVTLKDLDVDLSFISLELDHKHRHLILNLSESFLEKFNSTPSLRLLPSKLMAV